MKGRVRAFVIIRSEVVGRGIVIACIFSFPFQF